GGVAIRQREGVRWRRAGTRRERRRGRGARGEAGLPAGDATRAGADSVDRLHEVLEDLPPPYREVALLRWRYGLEPAEIAHVREEPPGTTRSLLSRALDRLRGAMKVLPAWFFAGPAPRGLAEVRRRVMERASTAAPTAA